MTPRILAALLPLLILGYAYAYLSEPEPAGVVLPTVAAMDKAMAAEPDIVVLGNSKVRTDLDLPALSAALPGNPKIVELHIDGTNAPIWYAVFKRRVADGGHHPQVILVYGALNMATQAEIDSEYTRNLLADQLGTPDPVINHKVYGQDAVSPSWQRVLNRRTQLHTALMNGLRDGIVGLLFASGPPVEPAPPGPAGPGFEGEPDLLDRGEAVAKPALAEVFGADAMTDTDRARAIPVAEVSDARTPKKLDGAGDTLIPDMIELARSTGAQIAFLRAPMSHARKNQDLIPAALEASVIGAMAEGGASYVDLRPFGPPDSGYGDGTHMNPGGRRAFSPAFIAQLQAIGLGSGQLVPADPSAMRARPTVTRSGVGPTLPAFKWLRGKLACDHQAALLGYEALSDTSLMDAGFGKVSPIRVKEDGVLLAGHALAESVVERCGGGGAGMVPGGAAVGAGGLGESLHWRSTMKFTPSGADPTATADHTYAFALDPAVPTIGAGFEEAFWVYPGTSLDIEFVADTVPSNSRFGVEVLPFAVGPAGSFALGSAVVDAGDGRIPLVAAGAVMEARGPLRGNRLSIRTTPDAPWLLVQRVSVEVPDEAGGAWHVLGGAPVETLVDVLAAPASFPRPARTLYGPNDRPKEAPWRPGTWIFPVGHLGVPSIEDTTRLAGTGCSALRLLIDGEPAETPVPGTTTPMAEAVHSNDRMMVRTWDESPPPQSPKNFSFRLDPERSCKHARWVYPGDQVIFTMKPDSLASLRQAATALRVGAAVFGAPAGSSPSGAMPLHVRVSQGQRVYLDEDVGVERLSQVLTLPLRVPLERGAAPPVVDLSFPERTTDSSWVLVTALTFVEPAPAVF